MFETIIYTLYVLSKVPINRKPNYNVELFSFQVFFLINSFFSDDFYKILHCIERLD